MSDIASAVRMRLEDMADPAVDAMLKIEAPLLRRALEEIEVLEKERDEARDTIIEMISGRYTVSEVVTALVKAGFR